MSTKILTWGVAIATLKAECVKVKHWMNDCADTPAKTIEFIIHPVKTAAIKDLQENWVIQLDSDVSLRMTSSKFNQRLVFPVFSFAKTKRRSLLFANFYGCHAPLIGS